MAAEDEVRQVSDQLYAALRQMLDGDLGALGGIWSHSSDATAMHPAPPLARDLGWEQVKDGFAVFARLAHGGQIAPRERRIVTGSDLAYATQIEEVQTTMGTAHVSFSARSSTVFRCELATRSSPGRSRTTRRRQTPTQLPQWPRVRSLRGGICSALDTRPSARVY